MKSTPTPKLCEAPKRQYNRARLLTCGLPARYLWKPRADPDQGQLMCKDCGELIAGNFADELVPIQ